MTQPTAYLPTLKQDCSRLTLAEQPHAKAQVVRVIEDCFSLCKTYGKTSDDMAKMQRGFVTMLGNYPPEKIIKAFTTHVQRSEELPTLAGIISLIKRNGKPPLTEAYIVGLSRKNPEERTPQDWADLREWEALMRDDWGVESPAQDDPRIKGLQEENKRLRAEVRRLESILERESVRELLAEEAQKVVAVKRAALEIPPEEQIKRTVAMMRETGASDDDVLEFLASVMPISETTLKAHIQPY